MIGNETDFDPDVELGEDALPSRELRQRACADCNLIHVGECF